MIPKAITRRPDGIEIDWDGAGHVALFRSRELRLACPCAACVEEMTGRPLLDPGHIPREVHAVSLALVGAYGLRVHWSDGHATGIYTFDQLRAACPCPRCRGGSG